MANKSSSNPDDYNREVATMAAFNPRGDLIYVGSSLGRLHVFDTQTKNVSTRIARACCEFEV